jgi:cephalosporin hydroxylase
VNSDLVSVDIQAALEMGKHSNLEGISYGFANWELEGVQSYVATPISYYWFLSGFVKTAGCKRILEIGTHMGGSALAMARGAGAGARIVTIDPTNASDGVLDCQSGVIKVKGCAEDPFVVQKVAELFGGPIDLLFVDGIHEYWPTRMQIEIYQELLSPKYIFLDDILLNDDMRRLWSELKLSFGSRALNLSEISSEIRDPQCGFGYVQA